MQAGEFKLSYPIDVVNVTIIGTAEWTVSPAPSDPRLFIFYRNQGVSIDNRSTLAIILVRALRGETNATVYIVFLGENDEGIFHLLYCCS